MSNINTTGFWDGETAHYHHVHSTPLANWLVSYLLDDKHTQIHDFGCGLGNYVKAFLANGFTKVTGYEGDVPTQKQTLNIIQQDLTSPFIVLEQGNCLCLEVMEHIPAEYMKQTLDNIVSACGSGKKLILSWAIRNQPGHGHVNCLDNNEVIDLICGYGFTYFEDDSMASRAVIDETTPWFSNTLLIFQKH